ncbi:MAG: hypothetical protein JWL69_1963 [Phycisphaerales bacterium]|nr:hypothetical protein [Phycisphaerales bacterium]
MRPGLRGSLLFLIFSATIFSGVLAVAASEITPPARQKTEVPNAAALRDARKRVNDVFADEIARAKTVDQKTALAKKMLTAVAEMKKDSDARYVLLGIARDLALAAGDFQEALAAVSALDQYQIDGIRAKTDVLAAASKSIQSPGDALVLVGSIDHVIDEALAAGRYDVAFQLAKLAASVAKSAKDADALSHATTRLDDVREIEAASVGAKKAAETLARLPHDPDAKLAMGRFEGFLKGRWETSLPLLAEGSDAGLKSLAQSELDHPADASKQLGLADGWWALAEKEKGLAQRNIRAHAAQCYATALPNLTGLAKAKAERRVKEGQAAPSVGWVDLLKLVDPQRDAVAGDWAFKGAGLQVSAGSQPAQLRIAKKPGKGYQLRVELQGPIGGDTAGIYLPVGDNCVALAFRPRQMGLDIVDGKRWRDNQTTKVIDIEDKKKHMLNIGVSLKEMDARIIVLVDGKQQIDWTGPASGLTVDGGWAMPAPVSLGLGSWNAAFVVSGMWLKEEN